MNGWAIFGLYVASGVVVSSISYAVYNDNDDWRWFYKEGPGTIAGAIFWPFLLMHLIPVVLVMLCKGLIRGLKERNMEPLNSWKKEDR